MEFRTLSDTSLAEITAVFNTAFTGYFVPINFTIEGMQERIRRARIDLGFSAGVFAEGKLVAFMLTGVGEEAGRKIAFNAGTGVVPEFRRRRLVQQMYDWAEESWRAAGFTDLSLEVIVENIIAIKAYERVGFHSDRRLGAYKFSHSSNLEPTSPLPEVAAPNWPAYESLSAYKPSWDYSRAGIEAVREDYRFYEWREGEELEAYAIMHHSGRIAQAGLRVASQERWIAFLRQLQEGQASLTWINIDAKATDLIAALQQNGWESIIEQFEMFRRL